MKHAHWFATKPPKVMTDKPYRGYMICHSHFPLMWWVEGPGEAFIGWASDEIDATRIINSLLD